MKPGVDGLNASTSATTFNERGYPTEIRERTSNRIFHGTGTDSVEIHEIPRFKDGLQSRPGGDGGTPDSTIRASAECQTEDVVAITKREIRNDVAAAKTNSIVDAFLWKARNWRLPAPTMQCPRFERRPRRRDKMNGSDQCASDPDEIDLSHMSTPRLRKCAHTKLFIPDRIPLLIGLWCSSASKALSNKWAPVRAISNITGAEAAREMCRPRDVDRWRRSTIPRRSVRPDRRSGLPVEQRL